MLTKSKNTEKTTEKSIDYEAAIAESISTQNQLTTERDEAQRRVEAAEREIREIQARIADRAGQLHQLERRVEEAEELVEKQESYVALVNGNAGTAELEGQREKLRDLYDQRARQGLVVADAQASDEQQIHTLQRAIRSDRATCEALTKKIALSAQARDRLTREQGEAMLTHWHERITELEEKERATSAASIAARAELGKALAEALPCLAQWPNLNLRRRFIALHSSAGDDSTAKVLAGALAFFDLLLAEGEEANQARAGIPVGCSSVLLSEMELSRQALYALSQGHRESIQTRRDAIEGILRAYRRNLAAT